MLGISVWLTFTFGAAGLGSVDVGGAFVLPAPLVRVAARGGMTLPHLILIDPSARVGPRHVLRHELEHAAQWDALGPGFGVAYAMGMGHGFESYLGDGVTWHPARSERRRCPLLRFEPSRPTQLLPCWRLPPPAAP